MWITTRHGNVSITQDRTNPRLLHVRSRDQRALTSLDGELIYFPPSEADYPWRKIVDRADVALWVLERLNAVDYHNFKGELARTRPDLLGAAHRCWDAWYEAANPRDRFDQEKARRTDPATSHVAAAVIKAHSGTARVRLLEAHGEYPAGLTDEEAAEAAGLSLLSEYATRMSELQNGGLVEPTGEFREGSSGMLRVVRAITPDGLSVLVQRVARAS